MYRQIFNQSRRLFSRLPLVTTLFLPPLWILNKTRKYTADVPIQALKSKPKAIAPLEIQEAEIIPERIGEYDDKNVIVYFMCGNEEEDALVRKLLNTYNQQYNQNIQVIFIKPSIDPHSVQLHHTFLTKRNYSKDIMRVPFKTEIEKLTPEQFINIICKRLEKYIHKIPEIDKESLSLIPSNKTPKVLLRSDRNSPAYKKHRILFENFMEKLFAFKKIQFLIVTDEEAAKSLGIDDTNEGSIHMLIPSENQFLKKDLQNNFLNIGPNEFALIKEVTNDQSLKENFIFMPFFNHTFDHILQLKVNKNKITNDQKIKLFEIFKSLSYPTHITYTNIQRKYELHYSDYDNLAYKILKEQLPELTTEQKLRHLTRPQEWLFKDEFEKDIIEEWIEKIKRGEVEPYYKSEPNPKIDMYSHKLTGRNFQQILVSTDNEVVFFYSDSCHNCAMFGELYEDIAKGNYSDDKLVMNHIEIKKNQMQCGYNTPVTPTLSFFKLESKTRPFTYDLKSPKKEAINNFIDVTKEVKLVDDELFNKFIESREGYNYQV